MENAKILLASAHQIMIVLLLKQDNKFAAMDYAPQLKNAPAKNIRTVGSISLLHGIAVMVIAQLNPVNAKQMMNAKLVLLLMIFAVNIPTNVLLRKNVSLFNASTQRIAHLDNIAVELTQEPVDYINAM